MRRTILLRTWSAIAVVLAASNGCGPRSDDSLTGVAQAASASGSYAYTFDVEGLPTSIGGGDASVTITRDAHAIHAGGATYALDALGRVTSIGDRTLAYGPDGQIASTTRGADTESYVYDETGRRILTSKNGAPVIAFVDEGTVTATELDEPVRVASRIVGELRNGSFASFATDSRGTALSGTDGAQMLASPFGDRPSHPDVAPTVDYAGSSFDSDLGTERMGVRDYDARIASFLQPDPLFLAEPSRCVASPVECSLYGYARSNPAIFADPTGMQAEHEGGGEESGALEKGSQAGRIPETLVHMHAERFVEHLEHEEAFFSAASKLFKSTGHAAEWAHGAEIYGKWAAEAAAHGSHLAHGLGILGGVLSGLDSYFKTLKEDPHHDQRHAIKNGGIAFGVDTGVGFGAVWVGGLAGGPPGALVGGGLFVVDGISGMVTGHSVTGALTHNLQNPSSVTTPTHVPPCLSIEKW